MHSPLSSMRLERRGVYIRKYARRVPRPAPELATWRPGSLPWALSKPGWRALWDFAGWGSDRSAPDDVAWAYLIVSLQPPCRVAGPAIGRTVAASVPHSHAFQAGPTAGWGALAARYRVALPPSSLFRPPGRLRSGLVPVHPHGIWVFVHPHRYLVWTYLVSLHP